MARLACQYGLVALIGLLVMAWGTSPCLYTDLVRGLATAGDRCECCCEEPPVDQPAPGTDGCPACGTFGNMHELPPMAAPIALDAPTPTFLPAVAQDVSEAPAPEHLAMGDGDAGLSPSRVAFRETVRLTR